MTTRKALNPAQEWVQNPRTLIFGVTYPSYNGFVIDDDACTPAKPAAITVADATGGYTHRVNGIAPVTHTLDWRVEIAPISMTGVWWSGTVAWAAIYGALRELHSPHGQFVLPARQTTGKICFRPQPSMLTFMLHVYAHEMQHVADARYLAQRIFGPWSAWLDSLTNLAAPLRVKDLRTVDWLLEGGDSGSTPEYRLQLYRDMVGDAGRSFHDTAIGRAPELSYAGTSRDGTIVWVDLTLRRVIENVIQPDGDPHYFFTVPSAHDYAAGGYAGLLWAGARPAAPPAIRIDQAAIDIHETPPKPAAAAAAAAADNEGALPENFWSINVPSRCRARSNATLRAHDRMTLDDVKAIVDEAHKLGKHIAAYAPRSFVRRSSTGDQFSRTASTASRTARSTGAGSGAKTKRSAE